MAHFAKVLNGVVDNIIVADQDFIDSLPEEDGVTYVQASYNTRGGIHLGDDRLPDGGEQLRYNYPGRGDIYDAEADAFYKQQPYPSWVLNTSSYLWEPPTPYPEDEFTYYWDEETTNWVMKSGCPVNTENSL